MKIPNVKRCVSGLMAAMMVLTSCGSATPVFADELEYLLSSAGYALMPSSRQDVIIRYCVEQGIYRLRDVNELLYEHTGKTL